MSNSGEIFTPLGMNDSGYDWNAAVITHRASGYAPGQDGLVNAGFIHMSIPFAAGGLYSTTEDLLRWKRAMFSNTLLSAESVRKMTTPEKFDYGMGLAMMTSRGRPVIQHGGVIVVVLGNSERSKPTVIAAMLGALAHGDVVTPPAEWKAVSVPMETLRKYVGIYESPRPEKDQFTVALDGDRLTVQRWSGDAPHSLIPRSPTTFLAAELDTEFEFFRKGKGVADRIGLIRAHFDDSARRVNGAPSSSRQ